MAKKLIKMVVPGHMTYYYDSETGVYMKGADNFTQSDDEIAFQDENGKHIELSEEMLQKVFSN